MPTWFISDLHLDPARPAAISGLFAFLKHIQGRADALYILGDFFEFWIGDDFLDTTQGQVVQPVIHALHTLTASGMPVYFLHGNRDFLVSQVFAERTGCCLLPEQQVIDLYGTPTLILHGDSLCTDDVEYQQARTLFRNPQWQAEVMRWSIPERLQRAKAMRLQSRESTQEKPASILDVNQQAVEQALREQGVLRMIHGHTHRPAIHDFELDGQPAQRIVLGDWYEQGSFLKVEAEQLTLSASYT